MQSVAASSITLGSEHVPHILNQQHPVLLCTAVVQALAQVHRRSESQAKTVHGKTGTTVGHEWAARAMGAPDTIIALCLGITQLPVTHLCASAWHRDANTPKRGHSLWPMSHWLHAPMASSEQP